MTLAVPFPADLLRIARKVVLGRDQPEQTLANLETFLAHLMVYGSSLDVTVTSQYVPAEEFQRVLENAPAGLFTKEAWQKWHEAAGHAAATPAEAPISRRLVRSRAGPVLWSVARIGLSASTMPGLPQDFRILSVSTQKCNRISN